jgi:glycerophosphoryl diester phosphodiesterase
MTKVFAHRGAQSRAPENSRKAFLLALEEGACGLECDVQFSRDGTPILWHDDDLSRVGLPGKSICDLSWDQLQQVDISALLIGHDEFCPLLCMEDFLLHFHPAGAIIFEIKNDEKHLSPHHEEGLKRSIRLIEKHLPKTQWPDIYISSFNYQSILRAHELFPEHNYIANSDCLQSPLELDQLFRQLPFICGICLETSLVSPAIGQRARKLQLLLATYTCNDHDTPKNILAGEPDIIITDYPAQTRELLNKLTK